MNAAALPKSLRGSSSAASAAASMPARSCNAGVQRVDAVGIVDAGDGAADVSPTFVADEMRSDAARGLRPEGGDQVRGAVDAYVSGKPLP